MASAADPETELKCPICVQDFQEPRKLPGCIHCFCENCILTFVLNLKKENKLGQEFECPVCRLPSQAPEDETVTLDWVRTMELNVDLNSGTKREVDGDDSIGKTTSEIALPMYKLRSRMQNKRCEKSGVYDITPDSTILTYNGILFVPNNQYFLTDSYCLADDKEASLGSWRKSVIKAQLQSDIFLNLRYATYLGNSVLAVSIPSQRKICFVTADNHLITKSEIKCDRIPKAICGLNNGDIAVSWSNPVAFGTITGHLVLAYKEKVYFTNDKSRRQLKSFDYMAIDEERGHVIQPCSVDKAVYCFNFDGQPIFKYVSPELKDPKRVGVDYEGDIYVCDMAGGIHVVSPEGQAVCIMKEGFPEQPLAIGFSIDRKSFAVSEYKNNRQSVHFFSIVSE